MNQTSLTSVKRRGRPEGTGIDDRELLRAVAEEYDRMPNPTTNGAIRIVVKKAYPDDETLRKLNVKRDSIIHRLAGKWREVGAVYLQEVAERKRQERVEQMVQAFSGLLSATGELRRGLARAVEQALPWIEAAASEFEAKIRSPQGQKALEFMAQVRAIQNKPELATWTRNPMRSMN